MCVAYADPDKHVCELQLMHSKLYEVHCKVIAQCTATGYGFSIKGEAISMYRVRYAA